MTVGAPHISHPCSSSGAVYVLGRTVTGGAGAGEYERAGMLKSPPEGKWFGASIAVSGTLVVIGAPLESGGAVHVFRWDGTAASEAVAAGDPVAFAWEARLEPSPREPIQYFGSSVTAAVRSGGGAHDGVEYVVVGADSENNGSSGSATSAVTTDSGNTGSRTGGVYVFAGHPLVQLAHLKAETQVPNQRCGYSVSLNDGGVLAVSQLEGCRLHVMDLW